MTDRPKHPSGRPIVDNQRRQLPIYRVPMTGAVTPSLRIPDKQTSAIGFNVQRPKETDE